jgi:hypothetical protein
MKPFDNYEISPCRRYEEPGSPGKFYFEVCEPHEADVWTLYGHIPGQGVEAIGDFATREHAEETFQRITGIPFASAREVADRLRLMHAAPKMLESLRAALAWIDAQLFVQRIEIQETIRKVIAEATGESVVNRLLPPDPRNMNDSRAAWAGAALSTFMTQTGTDREDAMSDLLADLMHWADRNGQDFDAALDRAREHYKAEIDARQQHTEIQP